MGNQYQHNEDILLSELSNKDNVIVLYNDDVNSFDHVINSLVILPSLILFKLSNVLG